MKVEKINVDEAVQVVNVGIADIDRGELPKEDFKDSVKSLITVVDIFLERYKNRKRSKQKSSERSKEKTEDKDKDKDGKKDKHPPRDQLLSKRYPDVPVIEKEVDFEKVPNCDCCQSPMVDVGLREKAEQLGVIPKKYFIIRTSRKKYGCPHCCSEVKTAPPTPRIVPGSSYSDDVIMDVALSKYCDLVPMERYVQMASRNGVDGLPANSLIGLTHKLADFLKDVCEKQKSEVLASKVLEADETTHKMLEGYQEKKNYYLWGFKTTTSCFFDIRNTRAGKVAMDILKDSSCEYLVSDVYSGYSKAVKKANVYRGEEGLPLISHVYCNAHARRKFKEAEGNYPEHAKLFIFCYAKIYQLEKAVKKEELLKKKLSLRKYMTLYFNAMKIKAENLSESYSSHSSIRKAIRYFLKNFKEFTKCLTNLDLPLDNNAMERLLRSPVVGRKTWYGTHSERGATTAARLFTIVEACKLNGVNPREYLPHAVKSIHNGESPPTPYEYSKMGPPSKDDDPFDTS